MGQGAGGAVAAITLTLLATLQGQPLQMARPYPLALGIGQLQRQRHVGRQTHLDRAIRLDRGIAHQFAHQLAAGHAKGAVIEIHHIIVGHGHATPEADKVHRPLLTGGTRRVGQRGDTAGGDIDTIEVIDTADGENGAALGHTAAVQLPLAVTNRRIGTERRPWPRLHHHRLGQHQPVAGQHHRALGLLGRVVDPDAVERRRRLGPCGAEVVSGAGLNRPRRLGSGVELHAAG